MASLDQPQDFEQRVRWTATVTLGLLLAAHTLLETGRDALFLANIPVQRLPWVYIAVAGLALWVARVAGQGASARTLGQRLVLLQMLAAVSIFGFWWWVEGSGEWLYYALYVWSGVISSATVVTFWMVLGDLFTITQGKRLFASIAIGGSVGALAGAALATAIAPLASAPGLLLASAALFGASALGPLALLKRTKTAEESVDSTEAARAGVSAGIRKVFAHPYACRVAVLVMLASATITFGDYLFKSVLAEEVPADQLSNWLARIYLGLNLLSIAMLGIGVTPLVRRIGVDKSLTVLPTAIAVATLAVFAGEALLAIVLLKAADGTLRYSLHKTASELLFLPMDSALRNQVKGVIDLVGSSAAKALASIAILALVLLPNARNAIAVALIASAVTWAVMAWRLRDAYLDVFRRTLTEGSIETRIDYPEMDVASLESLIRALGAKDERQVRASLELLVERGRAELIPGLILYHPSHEVVARAIELFADAGREDVLDFADRLVEHEYAAVRAAIVRATSVLAPNRERLEEFRAASCPSIRLSAVAGLLSQGWIDEDEANLQFQSALDHPQPETRLAIANAAKLRYVQVYRKILPALARDPELEVAREAVLAMHRSQDIWYTPVLVELLDERATRDLVRVALVDRGEPALAALGTALLSSETPITVLRHIPRTISRFSSPAALEILLSGLSDVPSGMVRYKILRGLQPLITGEVRLPFDRRRIDLELFETVERALFLLQLEAALAQGQAENAKHASVGGRLLIDLVHDKCVLATGRCFLLLALLHPDEDFESIESGIQSRAPSSRASGIELLEGVVDRDVARAIVNLAASGDPRERLEAASPSLAAALPDYAAAVHRLAEEDQSNTLQAFAYYHISEVDLDETAGGKAAAGKRTAESVRVVALRLIEKLPEALTRRALAKTDAAAARA